MIPKEITTDLQNGLSLEETLIKHQTNLKELFTSKHVPGVIDEWTYIQPTRYNSFRVSKTINQRRIEFGSYKTHAEALLVRNHLMKCNWDKSKLKAIQEKCEVTPSQWGGLR